MELVKQCKLNKSDEIETALFGIFNPQGLFTGVIESKDAEDSIFIEGTLLDATDEVFSCEKVYCYLEKLQIGTGKEWLSLGVLHAKEKAIHNHHNNLPVITIAKYGGVVFDMEVLPSLVVLPFKQQISLKNLFDKYFDILRQHIKILTLSGKLTIDSSNVCNYLDKHLTGDTLPTLYKNIVEVNSFVINRYREVNYHLDTLNKEYHYLARYRFKHSFEGWFKLNKTQIIKDIVNSIPVTKEK